jgi:hypothetical protein
MALRRGDFFWRAEMTSARHPADAVAFAAKRLCFKVDAQTMPGPGYYERQAQYDQAYVETSPILVPTLEGTAIIFASPQRNNKMIAFAQKVGANYLPKKCLTIPVWWRLVDRPYRGKVYTAEQWVRDAGREYHRAWDGFDYLKMYLGRGQ